MEKMYCGMDIHKDTITGCVLNKEGTIIRHHTFPTHKDSITTFLYNLPTGHTEIAIETCGTWRGIHKILAYLGHTVTLADPRKVHYIAGHKKTDKGDAHILADLLRTHYLPKVYIPPQDILQLKDLTRHKVSLTRLRAQLQLKITAPSKIVPNKNPLTEEEIQKIFLASKDNPHGLCNSTHTILWTITKRRSHKPESRRY